MELSVEPGKYIIAVSGGVDSVALLHALRQYSAIELIVAHFDHGMRADSGRDAAFVETLAWDYGLAYISERVTLGANASEATARQARYSFLRAALQQKQAKAIITAHHQDDVLETALINLLRGTGRRGLTSLQNHENLQRPLLHVTKQTITDYALKHHLSWREDSTNHDIRYTRNYVRHRLLRTCSDDTRQQLLKIVTNLTATNSELDAVLQSLLAANSIDNTMDIQWFKTLPHVIAKEVMAGWLRVNGVLEFDRPTIERLVVQAKTKKVGQQLAVRRNIYMTLQPKALALKQVER